MPTVSFLPSKKNCRDDVPFLDQDLLSNWNWRRSLVARRTWSWFFVFGSITNDGDTVFCNFFVLAEQIIIVDGVGGCGWKRSFHSVTHRILVKPATCFPPIIVDSKKPFVTEEWRNFLSTLDQFDYLEEEDTETSFVFFGTWYLVQSLRIEKNHFLGVRRKKVQQ